MTDSKCTCCERDLSDEEAEDPRRDEQNDVICDECYHDDFEFQCCKCLECEHIDHEHEWLVVFNDAEARIQRGVYRIIGNYWISDHFSMWLRRYNLILVTSVWCSDRESWAGYACGHLCRACVKTLGLDHDTLNRHRGKLIDKQIARTITKTEWSELERLNRYCDWYVDTNAPRPDGALREAEANAQKTP